MAAFHDEKVDTFMRQAATETLSGGHLPKSFKEHTIPESLLKSSNSSRRKLCGHLELHHVPWTRVSGKSFQVRVLSLINHEPSISHTVTVHLFVDTETSPGQHNKTAAMCDFLEIPRSETDQYCGAYSTPILSAVKRKFKTSCKSHGVPESQQLSVLYVMFRDDAELFFAQYVSDV